MGGSININSKLGEGTQFKIDLMTKCIAKKSEINLEKSYKFENSPFDSKFIFIVKEKDQNTISSCIEKEKARDHVFTKLNTFGHNRDKRIVRTPTRDNAIDQINLIILKKDQISLDYKKSKTLNKKKKESKTLVKWKSSSAVLPSLDFVPKAKKI